jgi:aminopeptidase YwaD
MFMVKKNISSAVLFDGERAFKNLNVLVNEIGPRPSGSLAEKKAAEFIEKQFKTLGLNAWIQEFKVKTGVVKKKKLEVTSPYKEEISCEALPLAGGTGPEPVEGEMIWVENVSEEYITPDVADKIVLTQGYYRKGIEIFAKYKPKAIVNIGRPNIPIGHGWGTADLRDKYGPLPTVNITYEDGFNLLEKGAKKLKLLVDIDACEGTSYNTICELPGTTKPEEIIVVGGHFDSTPDTPGASDNAAGTVIAMELARVFKEKGSMRTMRFIAFGSEEIGCEGSEAYIKRLREEHEKSKKEKPNEPTELERTRLIVNIDVQGALIGRNSAAALGPTELAAAVKLLAKEMGISMSIGGSGDGISGGVYSSDNTSFSSAGVPSLAFIRGGTAGIHSTLDITKWLKPDALKIHGEFIERFLTRYAAESMIFPFERVIPESDRKALEKYYADRMRKLP